MRKVNASMTYNLGVGIKNRKSLKKIKGDSINISNDLWKYALLIAHLNGGEISTNNLREKTLEYGLISKDLKQMNPQKKEPYYFQIVRNLKSNRKNKTNPIRAGYFEDVKKGFKTTQKGIDFVKKEFKDIVSA